MPSSPNSPDRALPVRISAPSGSFGFERSLITETYTAPGRCPWSYTDRFPLTSIRRTPDLPRLARTQVVFTSGSGRAWPVEEAAADSVVGEEATTCAGR